MTHISPVQQRIRITFGKFGPLKYTSNLDVAKIWERVLRRANLPILYTQGFNTRPRIQLACPLPLGMTSECEILDVAMREPISLEGVIERLQVVSPGGLRIYSIDTVDIQGPALQAMIRSAEYRITFEDEIDHEELRRRCESLLAADELRITRIRKGKKSVYDLRPLIFGLTIDDHNQLIAHLASGDHGNLRPDELLEQMALADRYYSVHRFKLHSEGV